MIIDSHAHLGHDYVFDEDSSEDGLLFHYKKYHVDGAIIQPFINCPYLEDTRQIHDRIYEFCNNNPGHYWGMASINPHFSPEDYEKEAARCIKELGFVAIKITPIAHAVHPSSRDGFHVFEVARYLGVPVMIHTGGGIPFSDPVSLIPAIKSFPDVKMVLAHGGSDAYFAQALYLAETYTNVYMEPSWLNILNTRKLIKSIGASKVMFSSDHGINVPMELTKYRTLVEDEKELERILSGTAIEVFNLSVSVK